MNTNGHEKTEAVTGIGHIGLGLDDGVGFAPTRKTQSPDSLMHVVFWRVLIVGLLVGSLAATSLAAQSVAPTEELHEVVKLIREDKLPQARRTLEALLVLYPEDTRLTKLVGQLAEPPAVAMKPLSSGDVLAAAATAPEPGREFTIGGGLELLMEWIAPGALQMRNIEVTKFVRFNNDGTISLIPMDNDDELPATRATLTKGYWLGRTEVTQSQWKAVMGNNPSHFKGPDRPVEQVSWEEVMRFCQKVTERERAAGRLPEGYVFTLPTEAQWEFACRAGTTGDYAGDIDAMTWYSANSEEETQPVGQKQANALGLHDMHGNVSEWCLDWYGNYPGGSVIDPSGPSSGSGRVYRGGTWISDAADCRSASRKGEEPDDRRDFLGFRLALAPSS